MTSIWRRTIPTAGTVANLPRTHTTAAEMYQIWSIPKMDGNTLLTSLRERHTTAHIPTIQKDKLRAQLGAAIRPTDTHNETNGENYDSKVINWSPQAMFGYDIDDNTNIRMFYFGRSSQPSTSQLMPVPDNSDPLNVSLGNPYLIPYFSHNIRAMFGYTDKDTFMSIHGRFGGSIVQDPIVNAQWYDSNGAQYSIPVNGPTSGSVDGRVMINSPFGKNSKFSIFSMIDDLCQIQ